MEIIPFEIWQSNIFAGWAPLQIIKIARTCKFFLRVVEKIIEHLENQKDKWGKLWSTFTIREYLRAQMNVFSDLKFNLISQIDTTPSICFHPGFATSFIVRYSKDDPSKILIIYYYESKFDKLIVKLDFVPNRCNFYWSNYGFAAVIVKNSSQSCLIFLDIELSRKISGAFPRSGHRWTEQLVITSKTKIDPKFKFFQFSREKLYCFTENPETNINIGENERLETNLNEIYHHCKLNSEFLDENTLKSFKTTWTHDPYFEFISLNQIQSHTGIDDKELGFRLSYQKDNEDVGIIVADSITNPKWEMIPFNEKIVLRSMVSYKRSLVHMYTTSDSILGRTEIDVTSITLLENTLVHYEKNKFGKLMFVKIFNPETQSFETICTSKLISELKTDMGYQTFETAANSQLRDTQSYQFNTELENGEDEFYEEVQKNVYEFEQESCENFVLEKSYSPMIETKLSRIPWANISVYGRFNKEGYNEAYLIEKFLNYI